MKKLFLFFAIASTLTLSAQSNRHGNGHGYGQGGHQNGKRHGKNHLRYATMDNGERIVLFQDGTWEFAPQQPPPPLPVRSFTSEFWGGNQLIIKEFGKEVDKINVNYSTQYDSERRSRTADIAIGNAPYTFDEKTQEVRFLGTKLIGNARRVADAKNMAAYHFTKEIYNGVSSEFWGNYIIVKEFGKEIERIRTSYNTGYDHINRCRNAGISIGTANYQFDECDRRVKLMGHKTIGKAYSTSGAKHLSAFHFLTQHFENYMCGL